MAMTAPESELVDFIESTYEDPLSFVRGAYPWGEPGPLAQYDGPDVWQAEFLAWVGAEVVARHFDGVQAVRPIRAVTSSGHGIGKSTLVAWLVDWLMSTRPYTRGTVTANTGDQLKTKAWAAIQHWTRLCITSHWFEINSERMYHVDYKESWFCAPLTCREENAEAFQGQHAATSSSWYIFDEASNIADSIYIAAEGGLTDGEPHIYLFGNPTRSTGWFHRAAFGSMRNRWKVRCIDSRTCKFTNKAQIAEWVEDYGEDSDFVRVRVRGLPPNASDLQFIDSDRVYAAQQREAVVLEGEPLVCGLDVARGGADSNCFVFRCGVDARTIPSVRIPGEESRDSMLIVSKAADILDTRVHGRQVAMLFVDGTGIGGPIVDRLKQLGYGNRVLEVVFSRRAPDLKYANMRAFMWGRMREWLTRGCISESATLEQDLIGPGYRHDKRDRLLLEDKEQMKARGVASPDEGDALALTFAAPVVTHLRRQHQQAQRRELFEGRDIAPDPDGLGWMA